jgi:hypothetical protein
VAERTGVYTAFDYADIMEFLVKKWRVRGGWVGVGVGFDGAWRVGGFRGRVSFLLRPDLGLTRGAPYVLLLHARVGVVCVCMRVPMGPPRSRGAPAHEPPPPPRRPPAARPR